jgi:hypothetical protein
MAPTPEARPDRPVVAPVAGFRLAEQVARLKQEPAWISGSRNAITLVEESAFLLTLVQSGEARGCVPSSGP